MDDTGNVTQDGEENVDAEVGTAAALKEDTDGREDDGKDDLADVAVMKGSSAIARQGDKRRSPSGWEVASVPGGERHVE